MASKQRETTAKPKRKPPNAGKGRPKGSVNKVTATAREAIALVADGMAPEFEKWLGKIAEGTPKELGEDGKPKTWLVKPDPRGAAEVYLKAIEYHIPKLSRAEVTGANGASLIPATINVVGVRAPKRSEK